ncbi:zinc dependent phospholipase C family protein [Paenibacillus ferrarius]|uniref:zinc dependent phospholipase C family protein n=1 Tax=Paenibacillus ferrarius TaxID=1469647 RepID=UPI003D2B2CFF
MPNIWTHFIFGQQLMSRLGHAAPMNDKQLRQVFSLGCQGPDFLFYHNYLPWKKEKHLNELGSLMHKGACGPFLLDLVRGVQGRGLYNAATLYVIGFITHHILDRNMHPYVFYKSGFKKWDHQRFEIIMDTFIAKRELGIETWKTPVWKEIYVGPALPPGIVNALMQAARRHYPDIAETLTEQDWQAAYMDMIQAQKLFHDPKGLKRAITFGQISPFVFKKKPAPLDYLNEARSPWHCPTDPSDTYSLSVWDLWDIAMQDGETVVAAAIGAIERGSETDYAALATVLGNRSYETGKDCDSHPEIKYVQPIL